MLKIYESCNLDKLRYISLKIQFMDGSLVWVVVECTGDNDVGFLNYGGDSVV